MGESVKKIGLFGGTFDPIHYGHLILAEEVRQRMGLSKVIFIPSANPPHKRSENTTSALLRFKMVELAIEGNSFFEVSRVELDRSTPSYSLDTVKHFIGQSPKNLFFFIVGADSLFEMHGWYKIEELVELCPFVFVNRPEFTVGSKSAKELQLTPEAVHKVTQHFVEIMPIGISASEIRKRVARGLSVRYLVPEKVYDFIQQEGLYQGKKQI